jgi:hypothetical protein
LEFGYIGLKPAKDWMAADRGRDKYKYYRRNVVRKEVRELVRGLLQRELVKGFMLFMGLLQLFLILLKL